MSDMKTFTVRELDREPSKVLDVCDSEGAVQIRRRDGRAYILRVTKSSSRIMRLPDFRGRLKKIFPKPIPARQAAFVDRLLAGE